MEYTVNKLSKLSGVSARTLRYYDEIGLLKPAKVASSGYRIYGQNEVDTMQQILFYRELNFSLDDIQKILTDPNFDREQAFTNHLTELQNKSVRLDELINNVKKSMAAMKGETTMSVKEKFKGFSKANKNIDAVLKEISITGNVAGGMFLNEIEQVFVNIGEENVEFIYTFPIPEDASVSGFFAVIGDRRFTGVVREKEEALEKYQKAIVKGDSAYMLESHRDNIFQASLGNVAKGETVTVHISYIQDVTAANNEIRLLIPTLVSPRYIPGRPIGPKTGMGSVNPTGQVPDADFITPVQGETGYRVSFNLTFDLDNKIKAISSPSHDITSEFEGAKGTVSVNHAELNSDFVLNISLLGVTNDKFIVSQKSDNGYFSYVTFVPRLKAAPSANKEFIFMLDVSGSMIGENLDSAKKALKICLRNLEPGDIFNMIAFESRFECFSERGVEFTEASFKKANLWIDQQAGRGGTEIFPALRYAVESAKNTHDMEKIIMLLTDGQVGNEDEIVKYVNGSFSGRVFCVGIDVNVNDSFLNKISTVGNGYTEFYFPDSNEDLSGKIVRQFARSNAAYLKNIRFEADCGIEVAGNPPQYVYSDECCHVVLKADAGINVFRVIGYYGGDEMTLEFPVTDTNGNSALYGKLWAKKKIAELERNMLDINPRHEKLAREKIIEISVLYGVVCRYTSFIALNERDNKQVNLPKAVAVPVNAPKRKDTRSSGGGLRQMEMSRPFAGRDDERIRYSKPLRQRSSAPPASKRMFEESERLAEFMPPRVSASAMLTQASMAPDVMNHAANEFSRDTGYLFGRSPAPKRAGKGRIQPLVLALFEEISSREVPITDSEFAIDIRAKIIEISKHCDAIDFAVCFEEMDLILSTVEQFAGKGDQEFDDCFQKLIQLLDDNCRLNDESMKPADIASMQNFDGSFCQCSQLERKYTLIAAKRFISDSDSFLYSRQIKKLVEFFRRTDASVLEQEDCFSEYLE